MEGAISTIAQWELVQADQTALPASLPAITHEVETGAIRLDELLAVPADGASWSIEPLGAVQAAPQGVKVMGEIILAKLDAIGAEYKVNVNHAYEVLEKSPNEVTLQEMMKLQLDMAVVSLEIEVVGKGVQKAVQHVDTLSKLQ